jgi:hypothetical protein
MECRDTKLLIEAYWDRHLPPEMAERLGRHLDECPGCRGEYGPVTLLLGSPEPVATPERLRGRIMSAIGPLPMPVAGRPGGLFWPRWWLKMAQTPWAGALAACLTFVILGWVSSQIPVRGHGGSGAAGHGAGNTHTASVQPPHPLLAAGWAQAVAVRGPCSPLAAVAQTAALETFIEAPSAAPATFIRERSRVPVSPPTDVDPDISEMTIFVHRLSTLGA